MNKKTDELDFELSSTSDIDAFLLDNDTEFDDSNFCKLLGEYVQSSGKSKFNIANDSCISEPYLYNILKLEKRPSRDTVIKLSFGLRLNLESTERLLKLAGYSGLYVRHRRDSILKFAIENGMGLAEADELLQKYGYSIISE